MPIEKTSTQTSTDEKFRRLIVQLALAVSLGVTVLMPSLHLYTGLSYENQHVRLKAEQIAERIKTIVNTNPKMWIFLTDRIEGIFQETFTSKSDEFSSRLVSVRVLDATGTEVASLSGKASGLFLSRTSGNILDGRNVVGKVILIETVSHVWLRTFVVFLVALSFSLSIFAILRFLTFRALDQSIQERNDAQTALMHLNDNLEEKIQERTEELEKALIHAEIASQAKTDFLSSMSHELRTPMNAILGFAQFLQFNPKEPLSDSQNQSVEHILASGKHLMELIAQVLDLNKIEAKKFSINFEEVPARSIIEESLSMTKMRAEETGIQIIDQTANTPLPPLWTDSTRLIQALLNLLSNAVKYNRKNGTVILSCRELPDHFLRINVADNGTGIAPDSYDDLFKPFERLGREAGNIEGTGIGLSITKQVIELLDGKIGFKSEQGKGSSFWVDVPIAPETTKGNA